MKSKSIFIALILHTSLSNHQLALELLSTFCTKLDNSVPFDYKQYRVVLKDQLKVLFSRNQNSNQILWRIKIDDFNVDSVILLFDLLFKNTKVTWNAKRFFFPVNQCFFFVKTSLFEKEKVGKIWLQTEDFLETGGQIPLTRSFIRYLRYDVRNFIFQQTVQLFQELDSLNAIGLNLLYSDFFYDYKRESLMLSPHTILRFSQKGEKAVPYQHYLQVDGSYGMPELRKLVASKQNLT